jgi:pimeloyl-ACP methyl ester carboxylesterase
MRAFSRLLVSFTVVVLLLASAASARTNVHRFDPAWDLGGDEVEVESDSISGSITSQLDRVLGRFNPFRAPVPTATEGWYDQLLDPQNPADTRTFKQRYYVYSQHATAADSPVIYYICGEAECLARSFLGRFAEDVAATLGARVIALEHRYYGKSVPFAQLTTANLKYLSTENALADLARFQHHAMDSLGYKGKWIAMGGSYPGSLSAYYRLKHPELVQGALASSAPVQAKNNFEEYDSHVTQVVSPACAKALRKIVDFAEGAWSQGHEKFALLKETFGASEVLDDRDFLYLLADVTAYAVQYGTPGELCTPLESAQDPVVAYAVYLKAFLKSRGQTAAEFSPQSAMNEDAEKSDGMRQWYYQSCTEYGYWQDAHRDPARSTRSPRINADYDLDYCRRLFGITALADEKAINTRYYEPLLNPATTRILYTNGTDDPWLELSINSLRGNDLNPNTPAVLIQGKAHCSDLRAKSEKDPQSLQDARELFLSLARAWVN